MNAGHPPMVRILEVTSIGPLEHPDSQGIVTFLDKTGYIKLTRQATIFRIAGLLAVHPNLMSGIHSTKMQNDLSVLPVLRDCKSTNI